MTGKAITLQSPKYRVVIGDWHSDPDTWQVLEVQSIGRDMQAAETLFGRNRSWGKASDNSIKFQTVSAYYSLRRTGQIDGTFESFDVECIEVADAGAPTVGPTDAAADGD